MTDYLWDRTGPRDDAVAGLEARLAAFRYRRPRRRARWIVAAAAAIAAAVTGALLWPAAKRGGPGAGAAWDVRWLAGTGAPALGVGEWLATGDDGRARVTVADIGRVDLEPRSRARLVATGRDGHRLELERGTLHALVVAPPRLFVVDTPAATAVDLGCAYTLTVEDGGGGLLHVTAGHVQLEGGGDLVSTVPRGARCRMHPGRGPGVPWYDDAPAPLRDVDPADAAAVRAALEAARPRDVLTLEHLLPRAPSSLRETITARLAELCPDLTFNALWRCK